MSSHLPTSFSPSHARPDSMFDIQPLSPGQKLAQPQMHTQMQGRYQSRPIQALMETRLRWQLQPAAGSTAFPPPHRTGSLTIFLPRLVVNFRTPLPLLAHL
jgi:hypothetical protein